MKNIALPWPEWECVEQIGAGGYGDVYKVRKKEKGEIVESAVKIMSIPKSRFDVQGLYDSGIVSSEKEASEYIDKYIQILSQECKILSELCEVPNVVRYEDHKVISHNGWLGATIYIRMELLKPFNKYVWQHPMSEANIIQLGVDICQALEICHNNNPPILHRDIKAANIMVDNNGTFKLGDFGVARIVEETKSIHTKAGTPDYMAPEVVLMSGYGATADLYSLGIVLYKLLNKNNNPFQNPDSLQNETTKSEAEAKRISGCPIPPPLYGGEQLKLVIGKVLSFSPDDRYQSASDFREALLECKTHADSVPITLVGVNDSVSMLSTEIDNPPTPPKTFRQYVIPLLVIVALVGASGLFYFNNPWSTENTPIAPISASSEEVKQEQSNGIIVLDDPVIEVNQTTGAAFKSDSFLYRYDEELSWTSSEPSIAEVKEDGTIIGHSVGIVIITGTRSGESATAELEVIEEAGDSSDIPPTQFDEVDNLQIQCHTTTLLVGDSIRPLLKSDKWIMNGGDEEGIKWSVDDDSVLSVDEKGVFVAKSEGKCMISAEYNKKTVSQEINVVDVDSNSNANISADYDKLSMVSQGSDVVNLSFEGEIAEIGAMAYYSSTISCNLDFGELKNNTIPLFINKVYAETDEDGYITVLLYEQKNPNHILAANKILIHIN